MKPIFRNSVLGFNKEDVAGFIAKQNRQFEARMAEVCREKDDAARAFEAEKASLISDREELEALRRAAQDRKEALQKISALADRLTQQKDALFSCCAEGEALAESFEKEKEDLQKRVAQADGFREKAQRFDRLAAVLGEIVSGSAQQADPAPVPEADAPQELTGSESLYTHAALLKNQLQELQKLCDELSDLVKSLSEA